MTRAARILLVDDDVPIQRAVCPLLDSRGYVVRTAATGRQALDAFVEWAPDLIVLDLGLPDLPGTEVCRQIRKASDVPILVLSAWGHERDKVEALDRGADDYITKPFGPEELLARIRTALRRAFKPDTAEGGQVEAGDLVLDFDRRRVLRDGEEIRLTPKEFALLAFLAQHPGRVLTHPVILQEIWGANAVNQPEHLWVLVRQLRRKIERDPANPAYVVSEPWVGYRFGA
jgi:two-component system KDP operon response regulator KdpE